MCDFASVCADAIIFQCLSSRASRASCPVTAFDDAPPHTAASGKLTCPSYGNARTHARTHPTPRLFTRNTTVHVVVSCARRHDTSQIVASPLAAALHFHNDAPEHEKGRGSIVWRRGRIEAPSRGQRGAEKKRKIQSYSFGVAFIVKARRREGVRWAET